MFAWWWYEFDDYLNMLKLSNISNNCSNFWRKQLKVEFMTKIIFVNTAKNMNRQTFNCYRVAFRFQFSAGSIRRTRSAAFLKPSIWTRWTSVCRRGPLPSTTTKTAKCNGSGDDERAGGEKKDDRGGWLTDRREGESNSTGTTVVGVNGVVVEMWARCFRCFIACARVACVHGPSSARRSIDVFIQCVRVRVTVRVCVTMM